ncbi:hypothetical protein QE375_002336 [Microbacterium foliorum]|uniref:Uncharacterized protein n=1 Tax=Microbacterium foliorum TaxID=104336 RepID=A0ABU1HSI8_9MICO|nr:hypothetical protein [Microbacterium foliorum]MDR6142782.1 hypothetical protein [Microbacterium foliorum]
MQTIIYGGDAYLTGDDIADALLAYGRALGEEERAELVEIPVQEPDGAVVTAKFLIGPASQIVAKEVPGQGPELEDPALVDRLRTLTRGVESPTAAPVEMPDNGVYDLG